MAARLFFIPKAIPLNTTGALMSGAKANFFITGTTDRQNTFSDKALTAANANPVVADGNGVFGPIYLDDSLNYKVDLTDSDDNSLAGYPIDDLATGTAAAGVTVADAGAYFADTEVEAVLQDIGNNFCKKNRAETVTSAWIFAALNMQDSVLTRPSFKDYSFVENAVSSSSGTATYDLETGNVFTTLLSENITTVTLSNPPASGEYGEMTIIFTQDGAAGAYTVTWPAAVKWPAGTAPTISTGNDAIDIVTLITRDGGTTWFGNFSQAFA